MGGRKQRTRIRFETNYGFETNCRFSVIPAQAGIQIATSVLCQNSVSRDQRESTERLAYVASTLRRRKLLLHRAAGADSAKTRKPHKTKHRLKAVLPAKNRQAALSKTGRTTLRSAQSPENHCCLWHRLQRTRIPTMQPHLAQRLSFFAIFAFVRGRNTMTSCLRDFSVEILQFLK